MVKFIQFCAKIYFQSLVNTQVVAVGLKSLPNLSPRNIKHKFSQFHQNYKILVVPFDEFNLQLETPKPQMWLQ